MWQYQNTDELYHHGVLGMRWGHRKIRTSSSSNKNSKIKKGSSAAIDKYFEETKKNTKIRMVGYGSKIIGNLLYNSAAKKYNNSIGKVVTKSYADDVQIKGITGKALNTIGNVAISGSIIKQIYDFKRYY